MHDAIRTLVIDDDPLVVKSARATCRECEFVAASSRQDARVRLARESFDLVVLELALPDGSGLDLVEEVDPLRHRRVVVLTGQPSLDTARQACATQVSEYLVKPLGHEQWLALLTAARPEYGGDRALLRTGMMGRSPQLRETIATLLRAAPSDATVLITGESGTGKTLAARALHDASGRQGEFVMLDCGTEPPEAIARQLFDGDRSGASGAHERQGGLWKQAARGTLFLKGICAMPLQLQARLSYALDNDWDQRLIGAGRSESPVRVVASTTHHPNAAIARGRLREDLYYRLADVELRMPPLRERERDVIVLARAFIDRLNARYGLRKRLAPCAERILLRHVWPGNVRELRAAVQRAYVLGGADDIVVGPIVRNAAVLDETDKSLVFTVGMTLAEMERRVLQKTLAHYGNDKTAAARALGISVRTVHNHLARIARGEPATDRAA